MPGGSGEEVSCLADACSKYHLSSDLENDI